MKPRKNPLPWLDGASLVALVVTMCSQLDVRHLGRDTLAEGLGYASKTFSVALCDVVLALTVLLFVVRTVQMKAWKRLWWPPLPCWALLFAALIALVHAENVHEQVGAAIAAAKHFGPRTLLTKESKVAITVMIQFVGYFLIAPWLFVNLLHDRRGETLISRRDTAIAALFVAVAAGILLGDLQAFVFHRDNEPNTGPHAVDSSLIVQASAPHGFFSSGNIYSGVLCILLPLFWALWGSRTSEKFGPAFKFGLPLLTFGAFFSISSVPALIFLAIGITAALLIPQTRGKAPLGIAITLACLVITWFAAPTAVRDARASFLQLNSDKQEVKKQFIEWEVALRWNSPRERAFATGVAPGNYQNNIGKLYQYDGIPNEEKMPPDSNNLYLVQGVALGVLGLGTLLWVVGHFFGLARRALRTNPGDWIPEGVMAALIAWFLVNLFHAMIVRGAGLVLAFLFALAVIAAQVRNPARDAVSEN